VTFHFYGLQPKDLPDIPEMYRPRLCEDTRGVLVRDDSHTPVALATMDSWYPNSCMMHMWIGNPFVLRHGFAEEVSNFVFGEESGREKVIAVMPSNNPKVLKLAKHIGFEYVSTIKDGCAKGVDLLVHEMNKQNCRWVTHGVS
jgi:RimJ/RimL family protein N-acetyltransferase